MELHEHIEDLHAKKAMLDAAKVLIGPQEREYIDYFAEDDWGYGQNALMVYSLG